MATPVETTEDTPNFLAGGKDVALARDFHHYQLIRLALSDRPTVASGSVWMFWVCIAGSLRTLAVGPARRHTLAVHLHICIKPE